MLFRNRSDAGRFLAEKLRNYRRQRVVVLALPPGGLPVGRAIADALGATLDVIVAREISAPRNKELAIGAVSAQGTRAIYQEALRNLLLPPGYLASETEKQREEAARIEADLRGVVAQADLADKVAIIVDDGIVTGMTVRAAIADVAARRPRRIVVAAPVIAAQSVEPLKGLAHEVVWLHMPPDMTAISAYYEDFSQVTQTEMKMLLTGQVR